MKNRVTVNTDIGDDASSSFRRQRRIGVGFPKWMHPTESGVRVRRQI